jgi:hypothetical protein
LRAYVVAASTVWTSAACVKDPASILPVPNIGRPPHPPYFFPSGPNVPRSELTTIRGPMRRLADGTSRHRRRHAPVQVPAGREVAERYRGKCPAGAKRYYEAPSGTSWPRVYFLLMHIYTLEVEAENWTVAQMRKRAAECQNHVAMLETALTRFNACGENARVLRRAIKNHRREIAELWAEIERREERIREYVRDSQIWRAEQNGKGAVY